MKYQFNHQIEKLNRVHREERRNKRLRSLAGFGAAFVVFYSLLLPAFTMEKTSFCGYEEHTHTEECYEYVMDCPVTGENGTVISAEEFRKLPGAAEADAAFDRADVASVKQHETVSHIHTDDSEDDVVVSRATNRAVSSRRDADDDAPKSSKTASPSDYEPEDGEDFYFIHDAAGSGYPEDTEETASYAIVNADGAVETGPEFTDDTELLTSEEDGYEEDIIIDEAEDAIIEEADESSVEEEDLVVDAAEAAYGSAEDTFDAAEEAYIADEAEAAETGFSNEAAEETVYTEEAAGTETAEDTAAAQTAADAHGHIHSASCYRRVTVCGMEEHEHGLECFIDPEADVEDEALLEDLFPAFEETKSKNSYDYAAKLAEFQKGYRESVKNYMIIVDEDDVETIQGYTRYGDWAGDPYAADWSPLFAAFTADRAGLDIEGYEPEMLMDAYSWMQVIRDRALEDENGADTDSTLFREVEDYIGINYADYIEEDENGREVLSHTYYEEGHPAAPSIGELVFLDLDGDFDADHVGIITAVTLLKNKMTVMVGNIDGCVREEKYGFDDMQILGYSRLPETDEAIERNRSLGFEKEEDLLTEEDEADAEMRRRFELAREYPAQDFDDQTDTMAVQVSAEAGTFPAGTTMVLTDIYDEETLNVIAGAIEEGRKVKSVQAVDITFYNEFGEEIEPLRPVQVRMTSLEAKQASADQLSVVHLDNEGSTEIMKEEAISSENSLEASIEIKGTDIESAETEFMEAAAGTDLTSAEEIGA